MLVEIDKDKWIDDLVITIKNKITFTRFHFANSSYQNALEFLNLLNEQVHNFSAAITKYEQEK